MREIIVFSRVEGIEHGGVDFELNFLGESAHVLQVLQGEQGFQFVEAKNDQVEPAIQPEHGTVNVRPFRAGKIQSSQVCLPERWIWSGLRSW